MGRLSVHAFLKKKLLRCPSCHQDFQAKTSPSEEQLINCLGCDHPYPIMNGCPSLVPSISVKNLTKTEMQNFWGELYREAYHDNHLSQKELYELLPKLEKMFRHRRHLASVEMPLDQLTGKQVLEIGCGAGGHSALFSFKGAHVTAVDLSLERTLSTAKKLDLLDHNDQNFCLQADAEHLPFADHSFDIVYSNGVLHHTPDTEKTIREVYRVLKPGGRAVIMLYSKNSWLYWVNLFLIKGLLFGRAFRHKNWLGRSTEWMSNRPQRMLNPETKVYSKKEILGLFASFRDVSVRKNSFVIHQIPLLGKHFSRLLGKMTGYNQAGVLIYGHPWRNETRWEIWLGKYMGFAWNILATKS